MPKQKVNLVLLTEGVFKRKNVLSVSVVCASIYVLFFHHVCSCILCVCSYMSICVARFSFCSSFITVILVVCILWLLYFTLHIRLWCLLFDRYSMCCSYFFFFLLFFSSSSFYSLHLILMTVRCGLIYGACCCLDAHHNINSVYTPSRI